MLQDAGGISQILSGHPPYLGDRCFGVLSGDLLITGIILNL